MKSIQKMAAGKYYLIESKASANSVYFETDDLAKLFFRYCDYYLKDYLQIEEYVLNKDGWAMLIKVRSTQTIRKYYDLIETSRSSGTYKESSLEPMEIWRILSERVRLFISTYVRMSNKILGREGNLVRRRYARYKFDCLENAKSYIKTLRNDEHQLHQRKKKYRGFAEHFRMCGNVLTNPLGSSLWVEMLAAQTRIQAELVEIFGVELPILRQIGSLVLPICKLDKSAKKPSPPTPPKPQ